MQIGGLEFFFVSPIIPECDVSGNILVFSPAQNYVNKKNLPLNKWSKGPFCRFRLKTERPMEPFGVYAIVEGNNHVPYVGKCTGRTSTLAKRFNTSYGIISPRNCYQGGQSTNCHVNHLILETVKAGKKLSLFFFETKTGEEASVKEAGLIRRIGKPLWNVNEPW